MRRAAAGMTCLVLSLGLTGCVAPGDFEIVGRTGVTSVEGDLAVVWDSCGEVEVRSVDMVADREGLADDEENPEVGSWEMGERGYIVEAHPAGSRETMPGVHFTIDDVAALGPGEVLIGAEDGNFVGTMEDLADC